MAYGPLGPITDFAGRTLLDVVDTVVNSRLAADITDRVLASPIADRLLDGAVDKLLESDELWKLVDEIATSPAVTDAITHQSVGFVGQVAEDVRARSMKADSRLEAAARRALRRKSPPP